MHENKKIPPNCKTANVSFQLRFLSVQFNASQDFGSRGGRMGTPSILKVMVVKARASVAGLRSGAAVLTFRVVRLATGFFLTTFVFLATGFVFFFFRIAPQIFGPSQGI